MSTFLKTLIGFGVALALAAFVAGSLLVPSDGSPPREPIIVEDDPSPAGGDDGTEGSREQDPGRKPPADAGDGAGSSATDEGVRHGSAGPDRTGRTDHDARGPGGGGANDDDERDDDSHADGFGGGDDDGTRDDDGLDDDTGDDDTGDDDD